MRKIKQLALILSAVFFLFFSCKKNTNSSQVTAGAIPSDAALVVSISGEQLLKKSGWDKPEDFEFYKQLVAENKSASKSDSLAMELLKNPKASGLNIDLFQVYVVMDSSKLKYAGVVFEMKDVKKFESVIAEAEKGERKINDKGSYKMLEIDSDAVAVWNNKLLVIAGGDPDDTKSLNHVDLLQPKEGLLSNKDFSAFSKEKSDIGLWVSLSAYVEIMKNISPNSMYDNNPKFLSMMEDMKGLYTHAFMNFENDEIKMTYFVTPEAENKKVMEKYAIANDKFDNSLLAIYPEQSYFAAKASINWKNYYKLIKEVLAEEENFDVSTLDNNKELNTVLDALKGDVFMNLYGFAQGGIPMPLAGISFTVNSKEDFEKIMALVPEGVVTKTGDYYTFSYEGFLVINIAYKNNVVLVTNDANTLTAFTNGKAQGLSNSYAGKLLQTSVASYYLNLDVESYPQSIQSLVYQYVTEPAGLKFVKMFKEFSAVQKGENGGEIVLKFKSGKENSLKQLLKAIDEIAAQEMRESSMYDDYLEEEYLPAEVESVEPEYAGEEIEIVEEAAE